MLLASFRGALARTTVAGATALRFQTTVEGFGGVSRRFLTSSTKQQARRVVARPMNYGAAPGAAAIEGSGSATRWAVAGASIVGVLGLGYAGSRMMNASLSMGQVHDNTYWHPQVQQRVQQTFMAFGMGLGLTALSAVAMFRSGAALWTMQRPFLSLFITLPAMIGASMVVRAADPQDKVLKFGGLLAFNAVMGLVVSPLVALGGPLLLKAACITGGIVGSLAFVAANSPSDQFLTWAGPLSMGLGAVFVASLGSMFFPAVPMLHNISLYGGLVLFSGFMLYDSSKLIDHCKTAPEGQFDPVSNSLNIYMDALNIFIRIATILSGSNRRK
eukprot:m.85096 g.85096  ORF g.85096 m.85096 type:complete len:330 (+) comp12775_c0_seq1:481-1470(+)